MERKTRSAFVGVRMEPELCEAMVWLAAQNERSLSAEVRRALKAHVRAEATSRKRRWRTPRPVKITKTPPEELLANLL